MPPIWRSIPCSCSGHTLHSTIVLGKMSLLSILSSTFSFKFLFSIPQLQRSSRFVLCCSHQEPYLNHDASFSRDASQRLYIPGIHDNHHCVRETSLLGRRSPTWEPPHGRSHCNQLNHGTSKKVDSRRPSNRPMLVRIALQTGLEIFLIDIPGTSALGYLSAQLGLLTSPAKWRRAMRQCPSRAAADAQARMDFLCSYQKSHQRRPSRSSETDRIDTGPHGPGA